MRKAAAVKGDLLDIIEFVIDNIQTWEDKTDQIIKSKGAVAFHGFNDTWSVQVYSVPLTREGKQVLDYEGSVAGPRGVHRLPPELAERAFKCAMRGRKQA